MTTTGEMYSIARQIISEGTYMAIATSGRDAIPWCSPVFYGVTDELIFVFISSTSSRHGTNVRETGIASWAIYWGEKSPEITDGVMFGGTGRELSTEADILKYGNILYDQRFPNEDERAQHPVEPTEWEATGRRIYILIPNEVYKVDRDDPHGVSRVSLDLAELAKEPIHHPSPA